MMLRPFIAALATLALAGCDMPGGAPESSAGTFPMPDRPVSPRGSTQFSTEDARDQRGEAESVMRLAEITPGMRVADIGAGEGYYTIRLAEKVGSDGRVLAQDIDPDVLKRLGDRVVRERLDNVSIKLGETADPKLPENSFDRVFLVHMYHEVREPYAFLWNMWPSLKPGGQVIVVDRDFPTDRHGVPPLLLSCELEAAGFRLVAFKDAPELQGYYAQFERASKRPKPEHIQACKGNAPQPGGAAA
ncbi:MAG: class I SAM-dependent methyltransferase [Altererythrobacter sp.]|nr:class I SAM-dependent methyltransferase [Altererythrobacter sp.]